MWWILWDADACRHTEQLIQEHSHISYSAVCLSTLWQAVSCSFFALAVGVRYEAVPLHVTWIQPLCRLYGPEFPPVIQLCCRLSLKTAFTLHVLFLPSFLLQNWQRASGSCLSCQFCPMLFFLLDKFPFPVFLFFNFSFCLLLGGFSISYICLQTLPVLLWAYSYHRGSLLLFVLYKWGFGFRFPSGTVNPRKLICLWYTFRNTFLRNILGCASEQP